MKLVIATESMTNEQKDEVVKRLLPLCDHVQVDRNNETMSVFGTVEQLKNSIEVFREVEEK